MDSLKEIFAETQKRVALAAARVGRSSGDIRLIAVSKFQSVEKIANAAAAGQLEFGENYVQEWLRKKEYFLQRGMSELRWHLIGPLQRNKVRFVVGQCELIQSVDRIDLAQEIAKVALEKKLLQDVLMQVRVGNEPTKHGVPLDRASDFLERTGALPGLRVRGMMVLPPLAATEVEARGFLRNSRELFDRLKVSRKDFSILSMGTSHDFEWAIEEGATMVRVGTVIFGSRT